MRKKFILNRSGIFKANVSTDNQCKARGHSDYDYLIRATCGVKLDDHGFIIDHILIDEAVQQVMRNHVSSCELICIHLEKKIATVIRDNSARLLALYIRIRPRAEPNLNYAFMEYEVDYTTP